MNLEIHISDDYLAQLATLIAERLMETRQESLNAFLSEDPAFEAKPQTKAITYPAPAEPVAEPEPAVVHEVEAAPVEPNPTYTRDDLTAALIKMGKKRGRSGIQEVFEICGFDSAKDVPDDKIGEVIKLVEEML